MHIAWKDKALSGQPVRQRWVEVGCQLCCKLYLLHTQFPELILLKETDYSW